MDDNELKKAVEAEAKNVDGKLKISCTSALALAEKLNMLPSKIGKMCDELGIKISACQLGCFK